MLYKVEILLNSDQEKGRTDIYMGTTKQVAQIGVGPTIACSDTMLNNHGQQENMKDKHENIIFINKRYTFIVHYVTVGFHIPRSLRLLLSIRLPH